MDVGILSILIMIYFRFKDKRETRYYNTSMIQLEHLFPIHDQLHRQYGSPKLQAIYGAGQIKNPDICIVFMNPTAKNVSSHLNWKGLRAPWLGTKNVWKLFSKLGLFTNEEMLKQIQRMKPDEWTEDFAENLYKEISNHSLFITNIAKCTQDDARPILDEIYKQYLPSMIQELEYLQPKIILTLGNQVNSVLLQKPISVSNYLNDEYEEIQGTKLRVFPAYYPVGQGTPNMQKTIDRIKIVLASYLNKAQYSQKELMP